MTTDLASNAFDKFSFGNFLIMGVEGSSLSDKEKELLNKIKPIGLVLYEKNFDFDLPYQDWVEKLRLLLEEAKSSIEREEIIVSIDHEGGRIVRTPSPITRFPAPIQLKDKSYDVGFATGKELASLGVNLSFSPCVDIHSNPQNPIIGVRAFGKEPQDVAKRAKDYYKGLLDAKVEGCIKHYPGHGDTDTDSHLTLPKLNLNLEQLEARELVPYKELIEDKIKMIMTAHILFPDVEKDYPATLSPKILNEILRTKMGFSGVIISDDLGMSAIKSFMESRDKNKNICKVFNSGNDMVIVGRVLGENDDFLNMLHTDFTKGVQSGDISTSYLTDSINRIKSFCSSLHYHKVETLETSTFIEHSKLSISTGL